MKKIDLGVIVTTLIIVTISCSLAFFAARIVGNPKDINLVAKNVAITFTDTSSIADETISPGWNNVKTFTITNNSKEDFNYNILLKGLVNTFESINTLQYKITSDTGYNMDNYLNIVKTENSKDVVLAYDVVIPKGSKQTYQVEFKYVSIEEDQSSDMGKKLGGTLAIEESTGKPKIYDKLLADNPTIKTRTDFSNIYTESNVNTLYKAKENNTDVYYFAGDARNNWVKFGGYYWRIIRTNSDGSIRLLYHGTSTTATDAYIKSDVKHKFCWSENSQGVCQNDDPMYAGYMYGTSGSLENNRLNINNSTIKIAIDTWYKDNMIPYTKYLSTTAIYCNDRSIVSGQYNLGNSTFTFGAQYRLQQNNVPSYDCGSDAKGSWFDTKQSSSDMFTTPNLNNVGNGKLTYPIALITADELVYAGGKMYANALNYIYYNSNNKSSTGVESIWTMTPISWFESAAVSFANTGSDNPGYLGIGSVNYSGSLRPVISIKKDLIYKSGDGSANSPYEVIAEPVNTYTVSLSVNNGSGTGTVLVEEGKDAKFTVAPNSGYKAELETNTCGGTLSGSTYTISNVTSTKSCSITFKSSTPTLYAKLLADKTTRPGARTSFSSVLTTDNTKTLYTSTEDSKTVYYFAGNATDNWVKFGGYYWRIIRTNSDGGVRLLYHGTSTTATYAYIGTSAFNSSYNNIAYVSYMYGSLGSIPNARTNQTNSSTIKTTIDNWYAKNMTSYTKYLSTTAVYCNDRNFGAKTRLINNNTPKYDCEATEDKFTVDTSTGNGKLTYPIALMTADEVSFAGGLWATNAPTWYYYNSANRSSTGSTYWWLLSPDNWNGSHADVFSVGGSSDPGYLYYNYVNSTYGVRPAISLKSCVKTSGGDGSANAPYTIKETTSGC